MRFDDAVRFIAEHDRFLILCHMSPDGDTLGSGLALHAGLLSIGKESAVVCHDPVPHRYRFLPFAGEVVYPEDAPQANAVICVDIASPDRAGTAIRLLNGAKHTLNIDHHATNTRYADINCVEKRGAAAELVYELFSCMGVHTDERIAECLYTAIVTDTGNFAYSSTTADTLRIAADIISTGIPFSDLQQKLFHSIPLQKLKLKQKAYESIRMLRGGRAAVSCLSLADFISSGASASDSEGIVEDLRDIDTVEIAALLREDEDCVRLSLRGKTTSDVSAIALSFNGGGHRLAAGATIHESLESAIELVTAKILEAL